MKASLAFPSTLLVLCLLSFAMAQIPAGSTARTIPNEVEKADTIISEIIAKAEDHFENGKKLLHEGKREKARDEFDKAVDAILESGFDVRASQKLQNFYLNLNERIYKEELPPWTQSSNNQAADVRLGFKEQKVEPSPLDELSRLVLYPNEIDHSPSTCSAPQVNNLEIRGLRLGMSAEQTKTKLPGLKFTPRTSVGYSSASLFIPKQTVTRPEAQKGLIYVSLEFLEGRLTDVSFFYDNAIKWTSGAQFAERIAEALKLPRGWVAYRPDERYRIGQLQVLRCENIRFLAGLTLINYREQPVFYWSDLNASQIMGQRKREADEQQKRKEEERRRSFKP